MTQYLKSSNRTLLKRYLYELSEDLVLYEQGEITQACDSCQRRGRGQQERKARYALESVELF